MSCFNINVFHRYITPLVITILLFSLIPVAMAKSIDNQVFSDVPDTNANSLFINYLANRGMINGFTDGTFKPSSGLTRAEAVALLVRVAGLKPQSSATSFIDVPADHWAAGSIKTAVSSGLVRGYPDGTFRPNEVLNRAEGIALILRVSKQSVSGIGLPALEDFMPGHWAAQSVAIGLASEMIVLSGDKKHFLPDAPLTRGDMSRALAVLLTRDEILYKTELPCTLNVTGGEVSLIRALNNKPEQVKETASINFEDKINTSQGSSAELIFPDGTGILIKENTELTLKDARGRSYIAAGGKAGTAVDWLEVYLKQGQIFGALATPQQASAGADKNNNVGVIKPTRVASLNNSTISGLFANTKPAQVGQNAQWWQTAQNKKVKVKVDMPWGVASIRGTFWENNVTSNGSSRTSLLTGEAEVTSGGRTVSLLQGQQTSTQSSQAPPAPPTPMNNQAMRAWGQVSNWAQQRAKDIESKQEPALSPLQQPASGQIMQSLINQALGQVSQGIPPLPKELQTGTSTGGGGGGGGGNTGSVVISPITDISLSAGGSRIISVTSTPSGTTKSAASSNENVATVAVSGDSLTITGHEPGTTTITVTASKAGYTSGTRQFTVTVIPLNASIAPISANFDKNEAYQADLVVTMTLNGNTLSAIKNGVNTLAAGTDYTIAGNIVTIKKEYLAAQNVGNLELTFDFNAGVDPTMTVTVLNTAPQGLITSANLWEFKNDNGEGVPLTRNSTGGIFELHFTLGTDLVADGVDRNITVSFSHLSLGSWDNDLYRWDGNQCTSIDDVGFSKTPGTDDATKDAVLVVTIPAGTTLMAGDYELDVSLDKTADVTQGAFDIQIDGEPAIEYPFYMSSVYYGRVYTPDGVESALAGNCSTPQDGIVSFGLLNSVTASGADKTITISMSYIQLDPDINKWTFADSDGNIPQGLTITDIQTGDTDGDSNAVITLTLLDGYSLDTGVEYMVFGDNVIAATADVERGSVYVQVEGEPLYPDRFLLESRTLPGSLTISPNSGAAGSTATITVTYTTGDAVDFIYFDNPNEIKAVGSDKISIAGGPEKEIQNEESQATVDEYGTVEIEPSTPLGTNDTIVITLLNKTLPSVGDYDFNIDAYAGEKASTWESVTFSVYGPPEPPEEFTVDPPTTTDNFKDDGKNNVTITWTDSATNTVDHYEIVAKEGSEPAETDVVPGQNNIAPGTQTATFEWAAGANLYVAVVAVDQNGMKTLCRASPSNVEVLLEIG